MELVWWEEMLRLFVAALLGAVIGFDREFKRRPAGLRTMTLVSIGSAVFILMSLHATRNFDTIDLGRIPAGIAGGIGFLGAGVIIQSGGQIRGVTTAATVWVAAAVGAAAGLGDYVLAVFSTVLTLLVLWLKKVENKAMHNGDR